MVRFDVVTPKYDCLDVGFGSKAEVAVGQAHVRSAPNSGLRHRTSCLLAFTDRAFHCPRDFTETRPDEVAFSEVVLAISGSDLLSYGNPPLPD
jgi:hypothetical protein